MAEDPLKRAAEQLERAARLLSDPAAQADAQARGQARAAAQAAGINTPQGQVILAGRAVAEEQGRTREARLDRAQTAASLWVATSHAGQQEIREQTLQKQQQSTQQLQLEATRLRAEAAHYQTPQGQAQLQTHRQAEADLARARAELARARGEGGEQPAQKAASLQYRFDQLTGVVAGVASGLGVLKAAASAAADTLLGFGGKASPTHAATLQGSMDMFMAKAGQYLVPAMESAARAIQAVTERIPDPESRKGKLLGAGVSALFGVPTLDWIAGDQKLKVSLQALPGGQISGVEQYADRLAQAAVGNDEQQSFILKQQLDALKDIKGAINQLGPQGPGRLDAAFR